MEIHTTRDVVQYNTGIKGWSVLVLFFVCWRMFGVMERVARQMHRNVLDWAQVDYVAKIVFFGDT